MSGGHFDYDQYKISQIAESIRSIIDKNTMIDDFSSDSSYHFSKKTIDEFKKAERILKEAYVYAQRIDWLISEDDGEKTFHERLKEDLSKL